jgi:Rrf2 family protein
MKMSQGVEWGAHCAVMLAMVPPPATLPASRLAEYHGVPPAYLAKTLQALTRAGIIESGEGRRGGYRLARLPSEINLLEVVEAVEGGEPLFRCTEIRRRGPARVGARNYRLHCGIARAMWAAEETWRQSLRRVTIADLAVGVFNEAPAESVMKGAKWLVAVIESRSHPLPAVATRPNTATGSGG